MVPRALVVAVAFAALSSMSLAYHDLTAANWDHTVSGHTVLVHFYSSQCRTCKRRGAIWHDLMDDWQGHNDVLIVSVDCHGEGAPICIHNNVTKYPFFMHGDPYHLEEYTGEQTHDAFLNHVKGMEKACSPDHLVGCTDEQQAKIKEFEDMGSDARETLIKQQDQELQKIHDGFHAKLPDLMKSMMPQGDAGGMDHPGMSPFPEGKALEAKVKEMEKEAKAKDDSVEAIKGQDYNMLRKVHAHHKKFSGSGSGTTSFGFATHPHLKKAEL